MKRKIYLQFTALILITSLVEICYAQSHINKQVLTPSEFGEWPVIQNTIISDDGSFVGYIITTPKGRTAVVQAAKTNWKVELPNVSSIDFSTDSKTALLTLKNDSIVLIKNGTDKLQYIAGVKQCKFFDKGKRAMLSFLQRGNLTFLDLDDNKESVIQNVVDFLIAPTGEACVIKRVDAKNMEETVFWLNIKKGEEISIWKGKGSMSWKFDNSGKQLAFFAEGNEKGQGMTIQYYKEGAEKASMLIAENDPTIEKGFKLKPYLNFEFSNELLFFTVTDPSLYRSPKNEDVVLMGYQDAILHDFRKTQQRWQSIGNYLFSINLSSKKVIRLVQDNESTYKRNGKYALLSGAAAHAFELNWNKDALIDYTIISTETGTRKQIKQKAPRQLVDVHWSPDSQKLIYYDPEFADIILFVPHENTTLNLTKGQYKNGREFLGKRNVEFAGWLDNDRVLLDAANDIWLYNLKLAISPINLTKGIFNKQNLSISVPDQQRNNQEVIDAQSILIKTFNNLNHDTGISKLYFKKDELKNLCIEPMSFDIRLKAKNAEMYVLKKESASAFPNLYVTEDFIHYKQLSDLEPEKRYNYVQSEVHNWTSAGDRLQGVLYKPENFDSTKKYPVIFYYYPEEELDKNKFLIPKNSGATINIPFFVSHGYLVFQPFVRTLLGMPGETALRPVMSAANYLEKFPWIDTAHMGLNGHSMGGFETNYIIVKTEKFKAAVSGSGSSDMMLTYNSLWGDGLEKQGHVVRGQYQLGKSLWEDKELYFKNSPVLEADKIQTPLLLMHNDKDNAVPYEESLGFFLSLRRLGKPVWFLNYPGEEHIISKPDKYKDFQIRMLGFFDHYLKDKPEPDWMKKYRPFYTQLISKQRDSSPDN